MHGVGHPTRRQQSHQGLRGSTARSVRRGSASASSLRLHPEFDPLPQALPDAIRPGTRSTRSASEHLDFYLSQQRLGLWKFAVSLDVVIGHHPEGAAASYKKFRHGDRIKASERTSCRNSA